MKNRKTFNEAALYYLAKGISIFSDKIDKNVMKGLQQKHLNVAIAIELHMEEPIVSRKVQVSMELMDYLKELRKYNLIDDKLIDYAKREIIISLND